jgi:hypothetical protein
MPHHRGDSFREALAVDGEGAASRKQVLSQPRQACELLRDVRIATLAQELWRSLAEVITHGGNDSVESKSLGKFPRRQSTILCALRIQTTLRAMSCTIHDGDP